MTATIDGPSFAVSRASIRLFCDASLDYNPLHLDDDYMKGDFGRTKSADHHARHE
jgi:acyl dehydratase